MAIFIYFNILLRFLIFIFSIVFIGKKYISAYSDEYKTFTKGSNNVTPTEEINDITDMKNTVKNIEDILNGKVDNEKLEEIKEEYST